MATSSSKSVPKLAIIDDSLSVSTPHFARFSSSQVEITVFKDTLAPYPHPDTTASQKQALVDRLKPFDIISTMRERTPFPAELLRQLPKLRLLLATGGRQQTFDIDAAKELGITVARAIGVSARTNKPKPSDLAKGGANSTTQHTWAMILALARNSAEDDMVLKQGGWQSRLAFGLDGRTLGIAGMGRLGGTVARIGVLAWGMKVICWSTNLTQEKADQVAKALGLPVETDDGEKIFKAVSKEELFKNADVVSVHYVLSERSRGIIGSHELSLMKKSALLINTSRGPIVDEKALQNALETGTIAGAALDVFDIEPLPSDSPFRSFKWGKDGSGTLLLSPHMGYMDVTGMNAFYAETADNVERWLEGKELLNVA